MATAAACSPTGTSATWRTAVPSMRSTDTLLPARFATNAIRPSRLMDKPEGCRPTVIVSTSRAGCDERSSTCRVLSGEAVKAPSFSAVTMELATRPSRPSGVICRLVGGPNTELGKGSWLETLGCAGSDTSSTATRSCPPGPLRTRAASNVVLPSMPSSIWLGAAAAMNGRAPRSSSLRLVVSSGRGDPQWPCPKRLEMPCRPASGRFARRPRADVMKARWRRDGQARDDAPRQTTA